MKNTLALVMGLVLFSLSSFSRQANAAAVQLGVEGRSYGESGCNFYYETIGDFRFSFRHDELPWGTRVFARYGFYDTWSKQSWQALEEIELAAVAPYRWQGATQGRPVAHRGSFAYSELNFVIVMRLPNGETVFENGGSNLGYFTSPMPIPFCEAGEFHTLAVKIVRK